MDEEIMQTAEDLGDFVDEDAFEAGWNEEDTEPSASSAGEIGREEPAWEAEAPGRAERAPQGRAAEELPEPAMARVSSRREDAAPDMGMGAGEARRAAGLNRFAMARPDVRAESIPREVWQEFRESGDLLGAYARYENAQLRQRISALEQNQRNRERSAGSRRTAGADPIKDIFDAAWDEFDD